jgi:acyl-CoA synthetase (NDP forming)/RimJ/RimL family protein N-acetyltransferase
VAEREIERGVTSASAADRRQLVRDVLLLDGSTLRLRAPTPDDFEDIVAFYDGLSPESRYLRFHGFGRTDLAAKSLIEATGQDRVGLIGRQGGRIVAAAQYDVLREPGVAEVAFAVADDFRRRGTATRMLEQLAEIGAEQGLRRFDAEVLTSNRPMLRVFGHAGFDVRRHGAFGEVTVSLDISSSEGVRDRIDARDHLAAVASLRPILSPDSLAVVGASSALGRLVLANILEGGFGGEVMAVDDAAEAVDGVACAAGLDQLDRAPELVIIALPPPALARHAAAAAAVGAKAVLVVSSDFAGNLAAAAERQEELLEVVRAGGLRLLGPSSLGVVNTDPQVRLHALSSATSILPGRLAIGSQSGAIGIGLLGQAAARRLGVASYVSLGERVDVSTNDLLELWEEDQRACGVMLYMETFGNPEHFSRIASRVSRRKPILVVKGRRAAGLVRLKAQTHTAAALRGDAVVDALFHQAGMLRFRNGEELFNSARFFESQPLPLGRQVAIVSNSVGVATLTVDACVTRGLVVSGEANPVVLGPGAGAEQYAGAISLALADPAVDALIVAYIDRAGGDPTEVLAAVSDASAEQAKPVVSSIVGSEGRVAEHSDMRVPNFVFPEACAGVLARAVERREWLSRPLGERPRLDGLDPEAARSALDRCLDTGHAWLELPQGEELLATHEIPFESAVWCTTIERAVSEAAAVGAPVALKAACRPPETPADFDAVLLGLEGEDAIRAGWHELERRAMLSDREWMGALVQRLLEPGADLLIGAVRDPDLGPVMAVGLGGRHAGLGTNAAFRVLPGTDVEADELIDASESVVARMEGFRGHPRLHRAALRDLILRFSALLRTCPEAVEVDLNPVRLTPERCVVLEMRIRVERRAAPQRVKTW